MVNLLQRAEMFATYASIPVLFIKDLFGDGKVHWFIAYNFMEANPSSHIHYNELCDGKDITTMMNDVQQYDQALFLTQLNAIDKSRFKFNKDIHWVKIQ